MSASSERSAQLIRRLGVYLQRDFVPMDVCEALRREALAGSGSAAEIYVGEEGQVEPAVRKTLEIAVPDRLRVDLQARLDAIAPALSSHFGVALAGSEGVGFLLYERGGFYRPHRDRAARDGSAGGNQTFRRRVSVVVFLNGAADRPGPFEYAGGRLALYGLIDDPAWRDVGMPVDAEPGLLVAFDSATLHEVTPVTAGRRLTAVDWFY